MKYNIKDIWNKKIIRVHIKFDMFFTKQILVIIKLLHVRD